MLAAVPTDVPCEAAFAAFKVEFGREYTDAQAEKSALETFCERYGQLQLQLAQKQCPGCIVSSVFDVPDDQLLNLKARALPRKLKRGADGRVDCNNNYCYAKNPFPLLDKVPASVDFRELGLATPARAQGGCGSCWAFGTAAALEALVLRDQKSISAAGIENNPWVSTPENLKVSVQYLMCNLRGFNDYCGGGDASVAFYQLYNEQRTLETEANFPYLPYGTSNSPKEPKLPQTQHYIPLKAYPMVQNAAQETPTIGLYLNDKKPFPADTIAEIKSFLARGLPVTASMYTRTNPIKFTAYDGRSALDAPCLRYGADHQVIFLGYGKLQGQEVWVLKNSWGAAWGHGGYFYVPIGKDSFCLEHYAFGAVSKFYDDAPADLSAAQRLPGGLDKE